MDFNSLNRKSLQYLCKKNRIPANLTNIAMAKSLEALEIVEGIEEIQETLKVKTMASKEEEIPEIHEIVEGIEEIQETLKVKTMASKEEEIPEIHGFQSLNTKSQENSRTYRHRSHKTESKDSDLIDMNYKDEGENKEIPRIFPKTPATRKGMKGIVGQSSRRRYKKNEEVENHTETPKAVELVVGKGIGVVARRSTRLSSRKAFEDSVASQSNCRTSRRDHSAVLIKVLGEEKRIDQGKEEEKKDVDENGDSYAVVEESGKEDQEVEIHEISDDDHVDESSNEVGDENVPMIQLQQPSPRRRCTRATAKALEASEIVSKKKEDGRKASKILPNTRRSAQLSSRISAEENSREDEAVKMEDLTEENVEEQVKEEENKDHAEISDSCIVDPVGEDEEKGKKEESHGFSSSSQEEDSTEENAKEQEKEDEYKDQAEISDSCIVDPIEEEKEQQNNEVEENDQEAESFCFSEEKEKGGKNKDQEDKSDSCIVAPVKNDHCCSIVGLVEEFKENDQEVKSHDFSSSTQEDGSNYLVENDDSTVVLAEEKAPIEEDDKREEICGYSIVALVEEVKEKDQKVESHEFSSSIQEDSSNYLVENGDSTLSLAEEDQNNCSVEEEEKREEIHGCSIVEEVKEKHQEVESHDFSSSTQEDGSNYLVENGDSNVVLAKEKDQNNYIVAPMEEDNKKEEIHGYSIVALVEEVREKDQKVESHDFSSSIQDGSNYLVENGDSNVLAKEKDQNNYIVAPIEEDNKKEEIHGYSIVALVEEVREKDQKVESHDFSSSIQEDSSNYLVENGDSTLSLAQEDQNGCSIAEEVKEKQHQEAEINDFSSSTQQDNSNYLVENGDSTVLLALEDQNNDQELEFQTVSSSIESGNSNVKLNNDITKSHELSSFWKENSIVKIHKPFKSTEELNNQTPVNDYVNDSRENSLENSYVEDFSNQGNEEPFSDNMHLSETSQLLVCTQESSIIMEEEENLSLLFTQMTLNEPQSMVSSTELCSEFSKVDSTIKSVENNLHKLSFNETTEISQAASGDLASKISDFIDESDEAGFSNFDEQSYVKSADKEFSQDASFEPVAPKLSATPLKSSIVQTDSSAMKEVFYKEGDLKLLSLRKLRAMYKHERKKSTFKGEELEAEHERKKSTFKGEELEAEQERMKSAIKGDELESLGCNNIINEQKLNDVMIKEELGCLSYCSKLDSNYKQKINDDMTKKLERKRTPLKSLNNSLF